MVRMNGWHLGASKSRSSWDYCEITFLGPERVEQPRHMHEEDYVETSDAEEREQMQASSNIYWKHVLHSCNDTPPPKRIKVGAF